MSLKKKGSTVVYDGKNAEIWVVSVHTLTTHISGLGPVKDGRTRNNPPAVGY
jgi:hypothetical protein